MHGALTSSRVQVLHWLCWCCWCCCSQLGHHQQTRAALSHGVEAAVRPTFATCRLSGNSLRLERWLGVRLSCLLKPAWVCLAVYMEGQRGGSDAVFHVAGSMVVHVCHVGNTCMGYPMYCHCCRHPNAYVVSTTAEVLQGLFGSLLQGLFGSLLQGLFGSLLQGLVDSMLDTSCGCGAGKVRTTANVTKACLNILVPCMRPRPWLAQDQLPSG